MLFEITHLHGHNSGCSDVRVLDIWVSSHCLHPPKIKHNKNIFQQARRQIYQVCVLLPCQWVYQASLLLGNSNYNEESDNCYHCTASVNSWIPHSSILSSWVHFLLPDSQLQNKTICVNKAKRPRQFEHNQLNANCLLWPFLPDFKAQRR